MPHHQAHLWATESRAPQVRAIRSQVRRSRGAPEMIPFRIATRTASESPVILAGSLCGDEDSLHRPSFLSAWLLRRSRIFPSRRSNRSSPLTSRMKWPKRCAMELPCSAMIWPWSLAFSRPIRRSRETDSNSPCVTFHKVEEQPGDPSGGSGKRSPAGRLQRVRFHLRRRFSTRPPNPSGDTCKLFACPRAPRGRRSPSPS